MVNIFTKALIIIVSLVIISSCGKTDFRDSAEPLLIKEADTAASEHPFTDNNTSSTEIEEQDIPESGMGAHPLFALEPGVPVSKSSFGASLPDPATGLDPSLDKDGDGIPDEEEIATNEYVADYPRIVTRVAEPVTMEIRVSKIDESLNYKELLTQEDIKSTMTRSMDERQYRDLALRTMPYVTKDAWDESYSHSIDYGESTMAGESMDFNIRVSIPIPANFLTAIGQMVGAVMAQMIPAGIMDMMFEGLANAYYAAEKLGIDLSDGDYEDLDDKDGGNISFNFSSSSKTGSSQQNAFSEIFSNFAMAETMNFKDVDYIDNMSGNGIAFTNASMRRMSTNIKMTDKLTSLTNIGPEAGVVRANIYIKNESVNMPVTITFIKCTLSLKTPLGEFLPLKTFYLMNEDGTYFEKTIYGSQELGPFSVEVDGLNTSEITKALYRGLVPQIHVVSYKMRKPGDSNYDTAQENLKAIEETAKGRTAVIKIMGQGIREYYRVTAFDIDENGDLSPGISLKKALFNIYRKRFGKKDEWTLDNEKNFLTVEDAYLKWKTGEDEYDFSNNPEGNRWGDFKTYIKRYTKDIVENGQLVRKTREIEAIHSIGGLDTYNPFNLDENEDTDIDSRLDEEDLLKTRYWVILHNGEYFKGDINDPIWVGERYEIIHVDLADFNEYLNGYAFNPLQISGKRYLNTRWNRLTNEGEFARSIYLGKAAKGDMINLDVGIVLSRYLFGEEFLDNELGDPQAVDSTTIEKWSNFSYPFYTESDLDEGMPGYFKHEAKGCVNSIQLNITKSSNALFYVVSFRNTEDPENNEEKYVRFEADDLLKNSGNVFINRNSPLVDDKGNDLEQEAGELQVVSYLFDEYEVKVNAYGKTYGVLVFRESDSNYKNGDIKKVNVKTVETNPVGSKISFNSAGHNNISAININEGIESNAEFYIIRIYGPANYGNGNDLENAPQYGGDIKGHQGINIIEIDTPEFSSAFTDKEKNYEVPGLYRVEVYGANKNNISDVTTSPASNNNQKVSISYNRYKNLIEQTYISNKLLDPRSVDLEVNFNDGSGWFRLGLSSNDSTEYTKMINCRYTTIMKQKEQKLRIQFVPPDGDNEQNQLHNVFRGGANDVDVYLRTVPRPEFRDTIWLREQKSLYINDVTNYDALYYWLTNELTDATSIEDFIELDIQDELELAGLGSGEFRIDIDDYMSDLFFAPAVEHLYSIRSSINYGSTSDLLNDSTHVDNPFYRVSTGINSEGKKEIRISQIDSQYATQFKIYIRKGKRSPGDDEHDYEEVPWPWMFVKSIDVDLTKSIDYYSAVINTITDDDDFGSVTDLEGTTDYTVCVVAYNLNGPYVSVSSPVYKTVTTY